MTASLKPAYKMRRAARFATPAPRAPSGMNKQLSPSVSACNSACNNSSSAAAPLLPTDNRPRRRLCPPRNSDRNGDE